jgi:hypothetical protein
MKAFLILVCLFPSFISKSQISAHPFHLALKSGIGLNSNKENFKMIGVQGEYIFQSRIGLLYNIEYLQDELGTHKIHTSAGMLGSPLLFITSLVLLNNTNWQFGSLGITGSILMLACPDGVNYHIPIGYRWDIAPYVNLLGVEWIKNPAWNSGILKWATSYGIKGTFSNAYNFTFSAFIEARQVAGLPWGFNSGIGIGYSLGDFHSGWKPNLLPNNRTTNQ